MSEKDIDLLVFFATEVNLAFSSGEVKMNINANSLREGVAHWITSTTILSNLWKILLWFSSPCDSKRLRQVLYWTKTASASISLVDFSLRDSLIQSATWNENHEYEKWAMLSSWPLYSFNLIHHRIRGYKIYLYWNENHEYEKCAMLNSSWPLYSFNVIHRRIRGYKIYF